MALLAKGDALYAGLLTPQGKLLFEFFVLAADDGFWLETAWPESRAEALARTRIFAAVVAKISTLPRFEVF
jgi:folate-binding Fe-S cluster repair protein YgfZ